MAQYPFPRLARTASFVLVACLAFGCGDSSGVGKTYPVSGMVTLDGQPLIPDSGMVMFEPDASRGNDSPFQPAGNIDDDGRFSLVTKGKDGAPPGWYKVVVTALAEAPQHLKSKARTRPVGKSMAPAKYGLAKTSDLVVEVVADPAPGAYDLKLRSK
jgi:hypothetical protein